MGIQDKLKEHTGRAAAALTKGADEAVDELGRAVELDPRDLSLRSELGELLARAGKTQAAIRQFQQMAGRYATEGKLLKAITLARLIGVLEPSHSETQNALADLYTVEHGEDMQGLRLPANMVGALGLRVGNTSEPGAPLSARLGCLFLSAPPTSTNVVPNTIAPAAEPVILEGTQVRAPLFSMLDRDTFLALLQRLQLRWMRAGERIVEAGDAGDTMFIVAQGSVRVVSGKAKDAGTPIAILGEGSFFGEKSLAGESTRLATVIAAEDGLLFSLSRGALAELETEHPGVRRTFENFFRERLLANLLAVSPLFRAFEPKEKEHLAGRFWVRDLPPDTPLLEQGKPGVGFFVILRGTCEAFHTTAEGQRHAYPVMKEGDVFGEISLLFDSACTATVRSSSWCELLELPRQDFAELILPNPQVKDLIEDLAAERLSRTADLMAETGEAQSAWLV